MGAILDVHVRRYSRSDEDVVVGLLHAGLPGWRVPDPVARFRWKHEQSPFGPSRGWVLEDERGTVVGFAAGMRWRVALDGREYPARRGADMVVDASMRRRGIYQEFARQLRQVHAGDTDCVVAVTHRNEGSEGAARKAGSEAGTHLDSHLAPLRPHRLAAWWASGAGGDAEPKGLVGIEELLRDEPAVEDLIRRARPPGRLTVVRSVDYLRWRYAHYPGRRYLGTALQEPDGRLRGLLIGRAAPAERGRTPAHIEITELIVPEDDRAAMRILMRRVWRNSAAYAVIVTPMPLRGPTEALVSGFPFRRRRGWWFSAWITQGQHDLPADLGDARRWQLSLGEMEAM